MNNSRKYRKLEKFLWTFAKQTLHLPRNYWFRDRSICTGKFYICPSLKLLSSKIIKKIINSLHVLHKRLIFFTDLLLIESVYVNCFQAGREKFNTIDNNFPVCLACFVKFRRKRFYMNYIQVVIEGVMYGHLSLHNISKYLLFYKAMVRSAGKEATMRGNKKLICKYICGSTQAWLFISDLSWSVPKV